MTRSDAFEIFADCISRAFSVPAASISDATTASDVDGWDSLSHVTLIMDFERRLKVRLPVKSAMDAGNVGELVDVAMAALSAGR